MADDYRSNDSTSIRTLFCFGVQPSFFAADADERGTVISGIKDAFADLAGRFGVRVLGTMDDDELVVGPAQSYPWTAYILADAPSYDSVRAVCNVVRESQVAGAALWKYLKIEARVGRPLFFGNE